MKIVIMGCEHECSKLSESMTSNGHEVTMIEVDPDKFKKAKNELNTKVIHGDGTDTQTLEKSGIKDANIFIAASKNDESNFLASSIVKMYNVPKIIVRLLDSQYEKVFKEVGIFNVVKSEIFRAEYLEKLITGQFEFK